MVQSPSGLARDLGQEVAKAAPPLTVLAMTLNEWLALASIAYILLQAAYLLRKWLREERRLASGGSA